MNLEAELKSKGWYLSIDGLDICKDGLDRINVSSVTQRALDLDLRDIGGNFFTEDPHKAKVDYISGSCVLQIQKIKNATAPKYEYCAGAPPILRLLLTDGNTYLHALQWGSWKSITMNTPPGTKLYLKPGKITLQSGFVLLNEHQFTVLGGCVAAMVEKWELQRRLATHVRTNENRDGGPPPWIPFGKKILAGNAKNPTGNFKSLDQEAKEEKENEVFKQQRLANIAEVSKAKEGKVKVFGGGKDLKALKPENDNYNQAYSSASYEKPYKTPTEPRKEFNKPYQKEYEEKNYRNNNTSWSDREPAYNQFPANDAARQTNYKGDKRQVYKTKQETNSPQVSKDPQKFGENSRFKGREENPYNKPYGRNLNSNNDRSFSHAKSNDVEDLSHRTSQMRIRDGEKKTDSRKSSVPAEPLLKPGTEVRAKYWEDGRFYRAIVYAVGDVETCVVHFVEYGNYEEVLLKDVQPIEPDWSAGPISFHPTPRGASEYNSNDNYTGGSEYRRSGPKSYNRNQGFSDRNNTQRQDSRPTARFYQPPHQRQF